MKDLTYFKELANLNGIAGHERQVRNYMKKELTKYSDEIIQDKLGGIFGIKRGEQGPTIMIAGHMDEVGAMVIGITETGFIKMLAIGGLNPEVFVSQNVQITVGNNKTITGVVGAIPPHMSRNSEKKELSFDNLLLDIGADSKEHAMAMGVKVGQQITPVNHYYVTEDGKKIVSKAWDDRVGCAMALEVMKEIAGMKHPNTVIAGGTVQEEVGLRGAKVASAMITPDLFLAVDVSPIGDFLPKNDINANGTLGGGFLIRYYDPRCIMNPKLLQYFEQLAQTNNIKYQHFKSTGGTDAAEAQYAGKGTLATTVGVPGRYIHSTATMIHVEDLKSVKDMLLAIIKDFDNQRLQELLAHE
ncbi:MAG TPA: M42 family metallopeptidase [Bacilli bacterium]|jgi:putative aminopeptidase FrvX|nr:M42 family metallopeptidase [Acholeplasmataceae bacterium]HNZ77851.1 M42 family metallopeptidase [Bacilli bacterium]HOD60880.1 M42 family metallopeptidase [Bacilli bacterium]HOH61042.1 M42 family metallopeptidase [Bacilli bacterium]HPM14941.1 M42 family metallopeptidase [Bacilli bacterium]